MRWALAALLISMAQPALALSCREPDITRDFQRAAASDDTFIVVKGDLFFDEALLPKALAGNQRVTDAETQIPAWFKGQSLTKDGFTRAFERDVTLRVSCVGPWCGRTSKGEHLTFLRQDGQSWIMQVSPCGGMTYPEPTPEHEAKVLKCIRGEECSGN